MKCTEDPHLRAGTACPGPRSSEGSGERWWDVRERTSSRGMSAILAAASWVKMRFANGRPEDMFNGTEEWVWEGKVATKAMAMLIGTLCARCFAKSVFDERGG